MNNVTIANSLANAIVNVNTPKLGFREHQAETSRVMNELIERGEFDMDNLTRQEFTVQCAFHPEILALLDMIDEDLYIAEYIVDLKATMEQMGLNGPEGYDELMDIALKSMREAMGDDAVDRALNLGAGLMQRCMDAAKASLIN